jgi:hypothetical protein
MTNRPKRHAPVRWPACRRLPRCYRTLYIPQKRVCVK